MYKGHIYTGCVFMQLPGIRVAIVMPSSNCRAEQALTFWGFVVAKSDISHYVGGF